jgi:hypothetical protein
MTSLYLTHLAPKFKVGEEPERSEVRFRGQTGKHLLVLRLTGFDPHPTSRPGQKTPALPEREDRMLAAWYRSLDTLAREGHMTVIIGRRELIAALGGAAGWPLVARAQQPERPEKPVIG